MLKAVVLLLVILGVSTATGTAGGGTGSHSNMRQGHRHGTEAEGEKHKHHVPQRPTIEAGQYNDPKRPPPVIHNPKLLQDNKLVHDIHHIKEELPDYLTPEKIKSMSQRELDYHYFKIHDFDDNRKLDGLELLKALYHVHEDEDEDEQEKYENLAPEQRKVLENLQKQKDDDDWKFYLDLVDDVFEDNDKNKDGYLNYGEYINGRNRNYGQQDYVDNL